MVINKKKAYVALPISGTILSETERKAQVAKEYLQQLGYDTKTPFDLVPKHLTKEISRLESKLKARVSPYTERETKERINRLWAKSMGICLEYLVNCDLVYLLNGWTKSKGATIEGLTADLYGIAVKTEKFEKHTEVKSR